MANKIHENWRQFLGESSLSRVYSHMLEHDTAIVTSFRGDRKKKENYENNRILKARLLERGYGVTKVKGSYIENFEQPAAMEVAEESFFVVNLLDDTAFETMLFVLSEEYGQDSFLFIPKGAVGAYLFGTNETNTFPPYGEKQSVGDLKMGKESEFMTKVKRRPFTFKEELETYAKLSRNSKWSVKKIAEQFKNSKKDKKNV